MQPPQETDTEHVRSRGAALEKSDSGVLPSRTDLALTKSPLCPQRRATLTCPHLTSAQGQTQTGEVGGSWPLAPVPTAAQEEPRDWLRAKRGWQG